VVRIILKQENITHTHSLHVFPEWDSIPWCHCSSLRSHRYCSSRSKIGAISSASHASQLKYFLRTLIRSAAG
jgi:hypothetical protein